MRFNNSNTKTNVKLAAKLTPIALATLLCSGAALAGNSGGLDVQATEESDVTTKIVGGTETSPYSRPYQVAMLYNGRQICGGTLISNQWVLTAAHCLDNTAATSLSIRVGAHRLSAGDGQTIPVSQKIVHQNWGGANSIRSGYDIALLKLSSNASSQYTPAKLPTADVMSNYASVGRYVTVSGWGQTSNNSQGGSDVLREVDLPVISNSQCSQQLNFNMPASTICGGGSGGISACRGDSGGPYAVRVGGDFYNVGIVSWGMNCVGASAFTRTYSYVDWIKQNTGIGSGDPTDPIDRVLENGVPATGLSANQGSDVVYTMAVPSGATNISFTISGGSGDADLYTRFGSTPTDSAYDCRPFVDGNSESCTGTQSGGTYHVRVKAYATYSGVTLTGSYVGDTDPGDPTDPIDCSTPAWNASTVYNTNDTASQSGKIYQAKWWTQGDAPNASTDPWYVWTLVGDCAK